MRRYLAIGLAAILVVSLSAAVVSCTPGETSVVGTYVCEHYPDDYLQLHEDGTFHVNEMGLDVSGEWEVAGNELKLYAKSMGSYGVETPTQMVATAQIKGNKIYDEDGKVWVKK